MRGLVKDRRGVVLRWSGISGAMRVCTWIMCGAVLAGGSGRPPPPWLPDSLRGRSWADQSEINLYIYFERTNTSGKLNRFTEVNDPFCYDY